MNLTPDTNILVRAIVRDDPRLAETASALLDGADQIVLTNQALCELAWVLRRSYKTKPADLALTIRTLIAAHNVLCDHERVQFGLAMLDRGGDFANGVIAAEGAAMGGGVFVSFDKDAVRDVKALGLEARAVR
ncbi:MAG: type II toxin-antitoxin system VapC family toxin [Caulobacterales bacterium]